jgi:hypothetical protein
VLLRQRTVLRIDVQEIAMQFAFASIRLRRSDVFPGVHV